MNEVQDHLLRENERLRSMLHRTALRASDMDVVGGIWAIKFRDNDQVELFVEDDEWYHPKASFHKIWLSDLERICKQAVAKLEKQTKSLTAP
jgi:hypothetical protein